MAPFFIWAAALGLAEPSAAADALRLALPIDCDLGETCHLQQYVDRDPGPGVSDVACGTLANDGHKGTDFAVASEAAMQAGVAVLAAAPGIVRATRDGMADHRQDLPGAPDISGRECGNGVVLAHGDGWETQYCHLRRGSVSVRTGDRVATGARLGLVGLSGAATFPHVHLSLRRDGTVVDPFRPGAGCGAPENALWASPLAYDPGGISAAGLADRVPAYEAIKAGLPEDGLAAGSDAVALWVFLYNGRAGDVVRFRIAGPDGPFGTEETTLDRPQPFLFRAWGRAPDGGVPQGQWRGEAELLRGGVTLDRVTVTATLP